MVTDKSISTLSEVSKEQISFHKLLSNIDISDNESRVKSLKIINDTTLPKLFEPERQLLLFDLKGKPADEREILLKRYPNYKWNIENDYQEKVLLQFHKRLPNKAVQTLDALNEPNSVGRIKNNPPLRSRGSQS